MVTPIIVLHVVYNGRAVLSIRYAGPSLKGIEDGDMETVPLAIDAILQSAGIIEADRAGGREKLQADTIG